MLREQDTYANPTLCLAKMKAWKREGGGIQLKVRGGNRGGVDLQDALRVPLCPTLFTVMDSSEPQWYTEKR